MRNRANIIPSLLILIYLLLAIPGKILLAKFAGSEENHFDCNFNLFEILIYSINEFLLYIDNIIIAIWIYLGAKRNFENPVYYGMIGLFFGLLGLLFYLSINLVHGKPFSRMKIKRVAILLIILTIISLLLGFLNRLYGHIALDNVLRAERMACLMEFDVRLEYTLGGINMILHFLVSVFLAFKISKYSRRLSIKSLVWIIATLVLGIIPWIALNILILLKSDEQTTANNGYSK